jgi:hypothetical protein
MERQRVRRGRFRSEIVGEDILLGEGFGTEWRDVEVEGEEM